MLAAGVVWLSSLAATANASSQPPCEGCEPTSAAPLPEGRYPTASFQYGARYYGQVSPYPIGYYPYPNYYGSTALSASYGMSYYPYQLPVVAAYPVPAPYAYRPYEYPYYGFPWRYYGFPAWGYSGYPGWGYYGYPSWGYYGSPGWGSFPYGWAF